MLFAAPVRVIKLYESGKRLAVVTQLHNLLEFMLDEQSGIAGNTECSGQTEGGYTGL